MINLKLVKSTLFVLILRSVGAFSMIGLNYLISKNFQPELAGLFFWCLSLTTILTQFGTLGLHDVVLKFISRSENSGEQKFIYQQAQKYIALSLLILIIIFSISSNFLIPIIKPEYKEFIYYINLMAFASIFTGLNSISAFMLQAVNKKVKSILSLSINPHIIFISLIIILNLNSIDSLVKVYLFSQIISSTLAFIWSFQIIHKSTAFKVNLKPIVSMAKPMWVISIMSTFITWGGQFLAALWVPLSEIAYYTVAHKVALILNFFLIAINFLLAPQIAKLYYSQNLNKINNLLKETLRITYLVCTPILIAIIFFSTEILSLFGQNYASYSELLIILVIGQYINVITGPVGYILTMTGNERTMMKLYLVSGITTLLLIICLTPAFGIKGTAIAVAIGVSLQNIGASVYVKRKLKLSISPF